MALLSQGKTYSKSVAANASYPDTNGTELTDGAVSSVYTNYGGAEGSLYEGNVAVTIDLGIKYQLSSVKFNFITWAGGLSPAPSSLTIYGSDDNTNFYSIQSFNQSGNWATTDQSVLWSNDLSVVGACRYVRFSFVRGNTYVALSELQVYGSDYKQPTSTAVFLSDYGVM